MDVTPTQVPPAELAAIRENECLYCYLERMLQQFGCTGHCWSERWRDAQRPRIPNLMRWLKANGGRCCDCEVLMNVFYPAGEQDRRLRCAESVRRQALEEEAFD